MVTSNNMIDIKSKIFVIIATALLIRIVLVIFTSNSLGEHGDVFLHRDWGRVAYLYGPADTYSKNHIANVGAVNNLPPGATYVVQAMYSIHMQASKIVFKLMQRPPGTLLWINDGTFANMFLKIPAVISDILIGFIIYKIFQKKDNKKALFASSLFLFNPISIYNSAVWGQFDAVPTMFFVLSLFLLLKHKYFMSIFSVFLSLYIKFSVLPLLPLYLVILLFIGPRGKIIFYTFTSILIALVLTLPISQEPHLWLINFIRANGAGKLDNVSSNAYNFWWIILSPKVTDITPKAGETFIFFSYFTWGYLFYALFFVPLVMIVKKLKKNVLSPEHLFGLFTALTFVFYLFLATMHERYLYPLFPLLAIYVGFRREFLWLFIAVSTIHAINVIAAWQPIKISSQTLSILTGRYFSLSMSFALLFLGIYFYYKFINQFKLNLKKMKIASAS